MEKQNLETLVDSDASGQLGYIGDLHGSRDKLQKVADKLSKQAEGKQSYMVISDVDIISDRMKFLDKYSIMDPNAIQTNYVTSKILSSDEEREAYSVVSAVENNGGIEEYLNRVKQQMPDMDINKINEQIINQYKKFESLGIENKLSEVSEEQKKELQIELVNNQIKARSLDKAMEIYHAQNLAEEINDINKKGKIKFLVEGGNHTKTTFIDEIKKYLNNKEDVENIYNYEGAIKIGKGKDELKFQATGNIYGIVHPTDQIAYSEEEIGTLYPHMYTNNNIKENLNKETIEKLNTKDFEKSSEYKRITKNLKEKELDLLIMHCELGKPLGYENKKQIYPALDDVGIAEIVMKYLKPQEQYKDRGLTLSGHIHSDKEGIKEDFNNYNIRNAANITYKQNGKLIVEKVDLENNTTIDYDMNKLTKLYETEVQKLQEQVFGKASSNKEDQSDSYKKAA